MVKRKLDSSDQAAAVNVVPINNKPEWQSLLRVTNDGAVKRGSVYNVRVILENDPNLAGVIALDEFAGQIIKTKAVPALNMTSAFWDDNDSAVVRGYIEERYGWLFSKDNLFDAVVSTAQAHKLNPVKARIEAQVWDGKPRAENYFIDYLGAEKNNYTRAITRTWLTGAVARVYRPGCKFEIVPILEGGQGLGKSSAVRNLYPKYFNDTLAGLGRKKDDYQVLAGSWVVEIAELAAMRQTDTEKMKNFISAQSDTYRPSFGMFSTPHPRQCVFIGTTNQRDYLKDATGERRFFPIKCGVIPAIKDVWKPNQDDILQILAEVKSWLNHGEPLFLPVDAIETAKTYQNAAKVEDPMKDAIIDYLGMKVPVNWDELTTGEKQRYFTDHMDNKPSAPWLADKFKGQPLVPLDRTSAREILAVVFEKTTDKYLTGRTNSQAKHVKVIMDNMPGWSYQQNVILSERRVRGYIRDP